MKYTLIKLAFKVSDMENKASSDYLMSLCHSAYFHYVDDLVLVYAIISKSQDLSMLSQYPIIEFNFDIIKLNEINAFELNKLDIINGIKPNPLAVI